MQNELPKYLYKYVTIDALEKIIKSSSFRCQAPINFNDPFDSDMIRYDSYFNAHMIKECIYFFEEDYKIPPGYVELEEKYNIHKKALSLDKDTQQKIIDHAYPSFLESIKKTEPYSNIKNRTQESAIFCLSAASDNTLMWSHYADGHRGAVIEIDMNGAKQNNSWLYAAKPVTYSDVMPSYQENFKGDPTKIYNETIYTKKEDWSNEKEWRVYIAETFKEDIPCEKRVINEKFNTIELSSIIFGMKTSPENIRKITSLTKTREFSHVTFFQMRTKDDFSRTIDKHPLND